MFASGYASGPVEQSGKLKNSTRKAEYKFAADLITKQCKLLLIAGRHPYKLPLPFFRGLSAPERHSYTENFIHTTPPNSKSKHCSKLGIAVSVYLQSVTFELSFGTNPFNVSPNQSVASHFERTTLPPPSLQALRF
ncbi:hypothetical protein [Polaromonas sp.]|uniref:hypothetical protein n=1 Tax=Polaromonas sp. TaxID=1869339 RepID=UPI0025E3777D|nr:hypothetical protein [Polaromonas sp.]